MAVHAHPDDESSGTGGVLARYAAEGVRTVLVTCTDGQLGDGPRGVKPGEPGHDEDEVVRMRRAELEESCRLLDITHLELLGYKDSGMMGWPQNSAPGAFWNQPIAAGAQRLASLMEEYRPQVVVTYNEHGFYGHPDHIRANEITLAAMDATGIPDKLYYTAIPRSRLTAFAEMLRERGLDVPDVIDEDPDFGTPDELINAVIDCVAFADTKYSSLAAHASQGDNVFLLGMGRELFTEVMGFESFVRVRDRTGAAVPEDDLFAGLR
jgi:LmbE family N-acetylglucosaminyl deacetylase